MVSWLVRRGDDLPARAALISASPRVATHGLEVTRRQKPFRQPE